MEIKGNVKKINDVVVISEKFSKREVVITTDDMYPQDIMVQFSNKSLEQVDKIKVGQNVVIAFNLRGREWVNPEGESKYFNTIEGWRVSQEGAGVPQQVGSPKAPTPPAPPMEVEGDMPF